MSPDRYSRKFDFIFTGAGCAGLSLLMRMIRSGQFSHKKILLIDKVRKDHNDRTWCFWEKEKGFFEELVYRRWEHLDFFSESYSAPLRIVPYRYKMIRGIDFYNYCFAEIGKQKNIEIIYGEVGKIRCADHKISISIDDKVLDAGDAVVFNSIYNPVAQKSDTIYLQQHFRGWVIETEQAFFHPSKGVFMDFRVHQRRGAAFAYVLPFSEKTALVEYTLFTKELLSGQQYEEELRDYISSFLKIGSYRIREEESGIIPMTSGKFDFYKDGIYHIGTAGGQTKASSGYTFQFIQKQSERIVDCLTGSWPLSSVRASPARFHFYDRVLLRLLDEKKVAAADIFSTLFRRNRAATVFRFLDNETSFAEEVKIIATLPAIPFLKAALKR